MNGSFVARNLEYPVQFQIDVAQSTDFFQMRFGRFVEVTAPAPHHEPQRQIKHTGWLFNSGIGEVWQLVSSGGWCKEWCNDICGFYKHVRVYVCMVTCSVRRDPDFTSIALVMSQTHQIRQKCSGSSTKYCDVLCDWCHMLQSFSTSTSLR